VASPVAPEAPTTSEGPNAWGKAADDIMVPDFCDLSYNKQYDQLFAKDLNLKRPVAKPNKDAQALEEGVK
jgi:hypothetical protein